MPENIVIELKNVGIKFRLRKKVRRRIRDAIFFPLTHRGNKEDFWALKNITFNVKRGEVLGLIGHNGAGKSTLLRVIAGVYTPDEGEVHVKGQVSPLLSLGAGFQPDLTGRENIYMNGVLLGISKKEIDAKINDIIEFSGLKDFIDAQVRTYSSGMVARLGFSIATMIEPDILLIDEILSVGDKEFRDKARKKMEQLMKKARVIVIATHNTATITDLCNKVIWLHKGRIRATGSPSDIIYMYEQNKSTR